MAYSYPNVFYPQMQAMQQMQAQPQQMQSSFVSVRSETEARNYPVAYGNSVTFKDETAPYVYTKTMGFSQLDRPVFDKYKLVKEDTSESVQNAPQGASDSETHNSITEKLQDEIKAIWSEIEALKNGILEEGA